MVGDGPSAARSALASPQNPDEHERLLGPGGVTVYVNRQVLADAKDPLSIAFAFGPDRLTMSHPHLKDEAEGFEEGVKALAATVDAALRKYGKHVIDEQFLQKRVAEIAMNLYVQVACIARTTAQIHALGAEKSGAEIRVCRAVCRNARHTVKQLLEACEHNDDDEIRRIAGLAYESGGYFLPAAMFRPDQN